MMKNIWHFLALLLFWQICWAEDRLAKIEWGSIEYSHSDQIEQITLEKNDNALLTKALKLDFSKEQLCLQFQIIKRSHLAQLEMRFYYNDKNYYSYQIPYYKDVDFNFYDEKSWNDLCISSAQIKAEIKENLTQKIGFFIDNSDKDFVFKWKNLRVNPIKNMGYITLSFDDGNKEHLEIAKILARYDMKGVAYIIPDYIGSKNYLSLKEVKLLQEQYHWDICSHYQKPLNLFNEKEIINIIKKTKNWFKKNGFKNCSEHFAYPLGIQNAKIRKIIDQYYKTARVAAGGPQTLPVVNWDRLKVINVINSLSVDDLVDHAKKSLEGKNWGIYMFHKFNQNPQSELEYSWNNFEAFIQELQRNKIKITPLTIAYKELKDL